MQTLSIRFFASLLGVALLVSGCATTGPAGSEYLSSGSQTFLSGADVREAKSIAMGSAASKGWEIVDATGNVLRVRRPLNAGVAQAVVGGPVRTATVEVRADFLQRQGGVEVVVAATLVVDSGGEEKETIDFTDSYQGELGRSLDSLRKSWEGNRWQVAELTPPLPVKGSVPVDEGARDTSPAVQAWHTAVVETPSAPDNAADTIQPDAPTTPVAWGRASSNGGSAAPVEDRYVTAAPAPVSASTAAVSPQENMLVLNRTSEPGIWAYYAEHYAKIRGCDVAGRGALLEEKQPGFEIHRVDCENGQSFRVRCNAGSCLGIE